MRVRKLLLALLATSSVFTSINANAWCCINPARFNCYHRPGFAVQLSTNSLDFARYTASHCFVYGFGISPYTRITGNNDTNKIGAEIFARGNYPITDQLVGGLGLSLNTNVGKEDGKTIKDSYGAAPYFILEYAATPQVLFSGSLTIVSYYTQRLGNTTTRTWRALGGGSLQISYLFA